jgi:hypothetical protein
VTYTNNLAFLSSSAAKLLQAKCLSDKLPDEDISDQLPEADRSLLPVLAEKHLTSKQKEQLAPFTNAWLYAIIAMMGGYIPGKDRKAGWSILWYGYQKYLNVLEGYKILLTAPVGVKDQ